MLSAGGSIYETILSKGNGGHPVFWAASGVILIIIAVMMTLNSRRWEREETLNFLLALGGWTWAIGGTLPADSTNTTQYIAISIAVLAGATTYWLASRHRDASVQKKRRQVAQEM